MLERSKKVSVWLPLMVALVGYFALLNKLNSPKPVQRVPIQSFNEVETAKLDAFMATVPPLRDSRLVVLRLKSPRDWTLSLRLPATWTIPSTANSLHQSMRFVSRRGADFGCLDLFQSEDGMPLWEAFAQSPLMLLPSSAHPHWPYFSKDIALTKVAGTPAVFSRLRLEGTGPEKEGSLFVLNGLFVLQNKTTIVLRDCSKGDLRNPPEQTFYQVFRSLQLSGL